MYCLTDQQIDYILNDIRRNGVEMEDLQLNLLDHVCCIVEQGLEENGDFERFYASVIKTFYKKELKEIQEETLLLLMFKKYYTMKKIMIVSGAFSAIVLSIGILLKFMHAQGASACIFLGIMALSLIFLPVMFTLKMKEKQAAKDKLLVGLGALCAIFISLAVLFKVEYWRGANALAEATLFILAFLFLPIYLITGVRNPETRVNTIVSSVLLIAGCSLFLVLVRTPRGTELENIKITSSFLRSEQILQAEQKLLNSNPAMATADKATLQQGNKIYDICEELKSIILENETGSKTIDADFKAKGVYIGDGQANNFFYNEQIQHRLEELRQIVAAYNNIPGTQPLPLSTTVLSENNHANIKAIDALNDFNQMQMFVLQNDRTLLAFR